MSSTRAFGLLSAAAVAFAIGCGIGDAESTTNHGNHGGSSGASSSGGGSSSSGSSSGGRSSSSSSSSGSASSSSSSSGGGSSSSSSGSTSSSSGSTSSSSGAPSSSSSGGGSSSSGSSSGGASSSGGSSGAVKSAGCGKTSTLRFSAVPNEDAGASPGSGRTVGTGAGGYLTIQSGGDTRGFSVRLPDNYDNNKPYWLIFGFHWNGGTIDQIDNGGSNGYEMAYFGLQKRSNNGAIFVAPQGIGSAWPNSGGRDLKFVDDIVKLIEENYCVDTTHLFANGFSYGGGMSYAIACNRAKVFRGVAIYEGAVLSGCDNGNDPIAYWQMAGLTDGTCTVGMATPMRDRFVKNNGCTSQNPPQPPQPPPYLKDGGHVCTDYAGCSAGHPVRWCVHQSGHGNAIVDGTADLYNRCATPPNTCSASCPCSWVPDDVWKWMKAL